MHLDRVAVKNFRHLAEIDIRLQPGTVVVGENRSGKSNLIHALRLVLDPTLPNSERYLRREDFFDGLSEGRQDWDPMDDLHEIEISVEVSSFEDNPAALAFLAEALIDGTPMRARLTYRFAPRPVGEGEEPGSAGYEWRIFGGTNEDLSIAGDMRSTLYFAYLGALRDVASDIRNWRRSPLRGLLEAAAESASPEDLEEAAEAIAQANEKITSLEPVADLATQISERTEEMVGKYHALEAELGIAPLDPLRLLRDLRIYVDGDARRPLGSASLGALNVLYLVLLELGLEQELEGQQVAHIVTAIEEPEAHLHPHLQRLVFRRLLHEDEPGRSTIVTTQSPHIASVASPKSLVVLRTVEGATVASVAADADLDDAEWADMERYLDATRAELVFAKRILLVEGYAEQVLVPELAKEAFGPLDELGISVCAIHGTHFGSYARFLEALDLQWAVITDGDPDSKGSVLGERRAERILKRLEKEGEPNAAGIFVGEETFEYDLFKTSKRNAMVCAETLKGLTGEKTKAAIEEWAASPPDVKEYLRVVSRAGGKGRFAQRMATRSLDLPEYLGQALRYLLDS